MSFNGAIRKKFNIDLDAFSHVVTAICDDIAILSAASSQQAAIEAAYNYFEEEFGTSYDTRIRQPRFNDAISVFTVIVS